MGGYRKRKKKTSARNGSKSGTKQQCSRAGLSLVWLNRKLFLFLFFDHKTKQKGQRKLSFTRKKNVPPLLLLYTSSPFNINKRPGNLLNALRFAPLGSNNARQQQQRATTAKTTKSKSRERKTPIIKRPPAPTSPIFHQPKQSLKKKERKKVSPVDCLVSIRVDIYVELISSFPFWCREACRWNEWERPRHSGHGRKTASCFFPYRLYCRQKVKIKNMTHRRQPIRLVQLLPLLFFVFVCVYLFFFFGDLYCCPTKSNVKRHIIHTDTHAAQCYYETWKYRMPHGCPLMDDDGRYT